MRSPLTHRYLGAGLLALGLAACATNEADAPADELATLVVSDPNFDFSTRRSAQLELRAAENAEPVALEIRDSEGRRLLQGAFRSGATLNFKLPLGADSSLTIRTGAGEAATEQVVRLNDAGHGVANL